MSLKMKGIALAVTALFFLSSLRGSEKQSPELSMAPCDTLSSAEEASAGMRIGIYHAPSPLFLRQEDFDLIAAMGVDLLIVEHFTANFDLDPASALQQLDRAHAAGLKMAVHDPSLQHNLQPATTAWNIQNVAQYIHHPAFYGVEVRDEPNANEYPNIKTLYDKWREVFPADKWFYINLFPNYANEQQLGSPDYRQYVRSYMEVVGTEYLSYDHYPLVEDGSVRSNYFANLDVVGAAAKDYSVPLHAIILTAGHLSYRDITLKDLRWQVACVMAFGARAISHYNYQHKEPGHEEEYAQACIFEDSGAPTPLYYAVQAVNREIKAWDRVYLRFQWEGVAPIRGSGGAANPMLATIVDSRIDPEAVEGIKTILSDEDLLCGVFTDAKGNKGYMLVNASNPGSDTSASLTVEFDTKYTGVMLYENGASKRVALDEAGKATLNLPSGEGKFLIPILTK